MLHNLAMAYFALFVEVDQRMHPRDRICEFLGGDAGLADVALTALRDTAFRDDLPEADETISFHAESRHHFLAYPVLASLDLLQAESPSRLDELSGEQKRKILSVRYCVADTLRQDATSECHDRWLQQDPDLVLDMLYRCAVDALKVGDSNPPGLYDLDRFNTQVDRSYDIRVRLLRAFPVRAPSTQLPLLDRLLGQVVRFPDRVALSAVIAKKLKAKSATDAQKVLCLRRRSIERRFVSSLVAAMRGAGI
ncbi:MAG: hypothetical protein F4119_04980 [Acidimicrobiia bacterium]|nr:hypothetical protein [Acidimicrobiia bacterium]